MPSSEEVIAAGVQLRQWAKEALIKEGHPPASAEEIVKRMSREEQLELARREHKIYVGPYSPY